MLSGALRFLAHRRKPEESLVGKPNLYDLQVLSWCLNEDKELVKPLSLEPLVDLLQTNNWHTYFNIRVCKATFPLCSCVNLQAAGIYKPHKYLWIRSPSHGVQTNHSITWCLKPLVDLLQMSIWHKIYPPVSVRQRYLHDLVHSVEAEPHFHSSS